MDLENKCDIVQELLVPYKEGGTSMASSYMVKEHLENCQECGNMYKHLNDNTRTFTYRPKGEPNHLKKHRKNLKAIIIGAFTLGLLIICSFVGFVWYVFTGGFPDRTSDISEYGQWNGLLAYTNLLIFPEELPESAENIDYKYYNRDEWNIATCQVYLNCVYNVQDYEQEFNRLSQIEGIRYDEVTYPYPAFVAIQNSPFYEYEYALIIPEENRIVYILNKSSMKETFEIPKEYLSETMYDQDENTFSIYGSASKDDYKYWPDSHKN